MARHEITQPSVDASPEEFYAFHVHQVDVVEALKQRLAEREQIHSEHAYGRSGISGSSVSSTKIGLKHAQNALDANLWRAARHKEENLSTYIIQALLETGGAPF